MKPVKLSPAFQLVFSTVLALTCISGATSVWLSGQKTLSPQQIRVFENTVNTWQTGVGVLFGLLGGKAADLFDGAEEEGEDDNNAT
jgi:hypothetical protein